MKHPIISTSVIIAALLVKICSVAVPAGIVASRALSSSFVWSAYSIASTVFECVVLYLAFAYLAAFLVVLFKTLHCDEV